MQQNQCAPPLLARVHEQESQACPCPDRVLMNQQADQRALSELQVTKETNAREQSEVETQLAAALASSQGMQAVDNELGASQQSRCLPWPDCVNVRRPHAPGAGRRPRHFELAASAKGAGGKAVVKIGCQNRPSFCHSFCVRQLAESRARLSDTTAAEEASQAGVDTATADVAAERESSALNARRGVANDALRVEADGALQRAEAAKDVRAMPRSTTTNRHTHGSSLSALHAGARSADEPATRGEERTRGVRAPARGSHRTC